ncbi:hypothetical protein ACPW96_18910 [Micromonospora sp. DT81.3]|uniref:hypothetical protein n=1 Tax=Micromonospora sp. DT81.3 TaxID=3416523 RepID=UPI003CF96202
MEGRSDEWAELAALRRRAYSADADIAKDPVALARLTELEDRTLQHRAAAAGLREPDTAASRADAADVPPTAAGPQPVAGPPRTIAAPLRADADPLPAVADPIHTVAGPMHTAAAPRRRPGWHAALVAGTAAVAVALGAAAWWDRSVPVADPDPRSAVVEAVLPGGDRPRSSEEGYEAFLNRLRDDVLSTASPQVLASRIIHSELRPYGGMNGRSVWAGPTIDGAVCLIVSNEETPVIACGYPETIEAHGISIVLPSGYSDTSVEAVYPPGQSIRYTLGPGLSVTTQPAVD